VSALRHGVRLASALIAHHATRDYTRLSEPFPGSTDLASVASLREALQEAAASHRIGCRKQRQRGALAAVVCDAGTVVEGFSGTEGPAGAAVGLVPNGADALAVGPLCARIEAGRGHNLVGLSESGHLDHHCWVDDGTEHALRVLVSDAEELAVFVCFPSPIVFVHFLGYFLERNGR